MIMNDSWKERGAIIMETDQHYCSDGTAAIQRGICADSVSAFVIGLQSNCLSMPKLRVVKAKIESTKISPVSLRNKWRINFGFKKKRLFVIISAFFSFLKASAAVSLVRISLSVVF